MTGCLAISGKAFIIEGNVSADEILHPRHQSIAEQSALAPHCLAERTMTPPFKPDARWPIIICSGLFGVGLPRPQVPAALAAAGVRLVIASAFSPMFFEHSLNCGALLTVVADPVRLPAHGAAVDVVLDGEQAIVRFEGHESSWSAKLPAWALAGRSWVDELMLQTRGAGGLEDFRRGLGRR